MKNGIDKHQDSILMELWFEKRGIRTHADILDEEEDLRKTLLKLIKKEGPLS